MSSADTSLNRSSSSTVSESGQKLIIKAANQKYEDFVIEEFELNWTIKRLKLYLAENYPQKPESLSIRLIYSGKMLHDHWTLSECLRNSSEMKSHVIHLVHSATTKPKESVSERPTSVDPTDELTPDSSSLSSSSSQSASSSTSSSPVPTSGPNIIGQSFNQIQANLNSLYQQQQTSPDRLMTPKERFEQIHSEYLRYYESQGVLVQQNAWYSSYIQQLALYKHMYMEYIQSGQPQQATNTDSSSQATGATRHPQTTQRMPPNQESVPVAQPQINNNNNQQAAPVPEQQQQQQPAPAAADPPPPDVEDDWLSLIHNCVSFLVLFSIIFYYSSIERFLVILSIVIILMIYHNGWLTLQRRQAQPRLQPQQQRGQDRNAENQEGDQGNSENGEQEQQTNGRDSDNPNSFRLFVSFVLTFFTSLVPERPRIAN